ncbi:hypothetical protein [Shinella sp. BYT-45]|uniref:hypothetical protein n=1 Tax=Shinella sp. BYT-45 TaxID=3377377 RepID=UPI0039817E84
MSRLAYTDHMATDDKADTNQHVPEEHYCEEPGCAEWGGFGLARSKGEPVRWWCWEHYPYKEPGSTRSSGTLQA